MRNARLASSAQYVPRVPPPGEQRLRLTILTKAIPDHVVIYGGSGCTKSGQRDRERAREKTAVGNARLASSAQYVPRVPPPGECRRRQPPKLVAAAARQATSPKASPVRVAPARSTGGEAAPAIEKRRPKAEHRHPKTFKGQAVQTLRSRLSQL